MGLGDTEGLLEAIELGADMFDCVLPTRLARHGKALTSTGDFNVNRSDFEDDQSPLDANCGCLTCSRYSKAYLRHLIRMRELSSHRLLTIHNLYYTLEMVAGARVAIENGRLKGYVDEVRAARANGSP